MSAPVAILWFRGGPERDAVAALLERARSAGDHVVARDAYTVLYATHPQRGTVETLERREAAAAALAPLLESGAGYYCPALPPFAVRDGKTLIRPRYRVPGHAGGPGHRRGDDRWYE